MKTIRQAKCCYIVCSVLLCLVGMGLILRPATSATVIATAFGIVSLLYGVTKIIGYLSRDIYHLAFQFDLALGIFVTVFGIILIIHPGQVMLFLPFMLGLFILVDGVFKTQTAVDAKQFGLNEWWLILIGALLCVALGIMLMLDSFGSGTALWVIIGVSLLIDGIQNLFNALYTIKILRKSNENENENDERKHSR